MAEVSGVQKTRRRSTYQQLLLFTGSSGEIAADMTYLRVSLQDGVTAGGWFSQKGSARRATAPNTGLTRSILVSDAFVYAATQFSLVVQLPSAASYPPGQILTVIGGANAGVNNVSLITATSTEKMMGFTTFGSINSTQFAINSPGVGVRLAALSTAGTWAVWN